MTTQFELSAYGVEEMTKKEMIELDGGIIAAGTVWVILGTVAGLVSAYYAVKAYYDGKGAIVGTKEYIPMENRTIIMQGTADSLEVGGTTIYGLDGVVIVRP